MKRGRSHVEDKRRSHRAQVRPGVHGVPSGDGSQTDCRSSTPKRVIIKVGYACNNQCIFCHSSGMKPLGELDSGRLKQRIVEARTLGADSVLFSGGEPTLRKDLVELAQCCRSHRMRFGLITNARMLSYRPLLKELSKHGLEYVYLSLHGPEQIHDELTRVSGAFKQTLSALTLLNRIGGIQLTTNAVVVRQNLGVLKQLVGLLSPLSSTVIKFTYVEPKGSALEDGTTVPSPSQAAQAVSEAIDFGIDNGIAPLRFGVDGLPHCLDKRFAALQDDMYTHRVVGIRELDEDFHPIDYANMAKPVACRGCLTGDGCRGTWAGAVERFGDDYLRPSIGGVPNSFNYFRTEPHLVEPVRGLVVDTGGDREGYTTDTADYADRQIGRVRDELQQVYLQTDDKLMVNDFPVQLRKLTVTGKTERGVPVFSPLDEDLFAVADRSVERILSGMKGTVLDVGCGQTRYGRLLQDKLASGEIAYHGVDPQPGQAAISLADEGRIELSRCPVEDLLFPRQSFDWILVLRSHNHLLDLWTAYSRLVGGLKWGGHLLVVDNVSFGLVRQQVTKRDIESLPPGDAVGHVRDHDLATAARFLSRFPLELVSEDRVGPKTANQWLLLCRKLWPAGTLGDDTFPSRPS